MPRRPRKRQYGYGSIQRRGGHIRVQYRVGGRRRSKSFIDRDVAEMFLRKQVAAGERAAAGLPPDPREMPTLGKLAGPWLEARKATHRSQKDDRIRWALHLEPALGGMRPDEVTAGDLRRIIVDRLGAVSSATVQRCMRLLSTFYSDLIDDGVAQRNPVRDLPRKIRRMFRPTHDPRTTPFVEEWSDVGRIFQALPEPANMAYAIGVLAGLRTGEVLALRWKSVDLARRVLHVRESIKGPLKDDESRFAPIIDALATILQAWHDRRVGPLVIPPLRARARYFGVHALGREMTAALTKLKLPPLTFYQATRHTFASHWVMAGRTLEELREILGHSSVTTTERYAHLKPGKWAAGRASLPEIGTTLAPAAPRQMRGIRGKVIDIVQ